MNDTPQIRPEFRSVAKDRMNAELAKYHPTWPDKFMVQAAICAEVAEAMLREKAMAKPRRDVPSVEEILNRMLKQRDGGFDSLTRCARVAHSMMLELAPRKKMQIEGMTKKDLANEFRKEFGDNSFSAGAASTIATQVAHRLANTPAEPAPDPDVQELSEILGMSRKYDGTMFDDDLRKIESLKAWADNRAVASARREG